MNIMYYSMYILHISITHSTTHSTYIYIYIYIYTVYVHIVYVILCSYI